jgi:hypothetical protein
VERLRPQDCNQHVKFGTLFNKEFVYVTFLLFPYVYIVVYVHSQLCDICIL